jgi:hypothetical protein
MIFANQGKERRMRGAENRKHDDLRKVEAKALSAREALSLISTDLSLDDGVDLPDTDAAASGGGEGSVTSDDRTLPSTT